MLASRLGVALLIILGISSYVSMRPMSNGHAIKIEAEVGDDEDAPKITIGGVTIDPEEDTLSDIVEKFENVDAKALAVEAERAEKQAELANVMGEHIELAEVRRLHAEALKAASQEIAEEFARTETPEAPPQGGPGKLSEDEVQALVVERLLSVQSQMREEDEVAPSANPAPREPDVAAATSAVPAPTAPALPTTPAELPATLEKVEGDFSGQSLMGTDFRNKDLSGTDFSNAKLTAAKFDGSNLADADFTGARIQGASFTGAYLKGTRLNNAQAQTARFDNANLQGADLTQCNMAGADLTNADLRGAIMNDMNINGAIMTDVKMGERP